MVVASPSRRTDAGRTARMLAARRMHPAFGGDPDLRLVGETWVDRGLDAPAAPAEVEVPLATIIAFPSRPRC